MLHINLIAFALKHVACRILEYMRAKHKFIGNEFHSQNKDINFCLATETFSFISSHSIVMRCAIWYIRTILKR